MSQPLPAYPEYKPAGLPWLKQVPTHWEIKRAKHIFRIIDQRSETGLEEKLTVSSKSGVVPRREQKVTMFMAASYVGHKLCWPGDLVINSLWAWANGLGFSKNHGIISTAYSVYRPLPEYAEAGPYLDYLLRSSAFQWEFQVGSKGIWISRLQLTDDTFMRMPIVLPPLLEQQRIVAFLDGKTRQIARLLRHKRQLIKLLQEQKQALIHRAVTQGLDAAAPRKNSGVGWMGEVPAHWRLMRLKNLVKRIDQGVSPQAVGFLAEGDTWGVLKSGCVNHGVFRETEHKKLADDFEIDLAIAIAKGDVLISRACGSPALVGSVGRIYELNYKLILSDKLFRPVFKGFVNPDFFVYISSTRYYRDQVEQAISGAEGMANNLPLTSLKAFYFEIPPLAEQNEIVSHLKQKLSGLNETIEQAKREIELIEEYRTRLIADVVTGQVDVRQLAVAAAAPDELAELLAEEVELGEEEELEEVPTDVD